MQVGDKVRLLNEKGDGIVKKVTKDTVFVLIEAGFEVPYKKSEVFVVEEKPSINTNQSTDPTDKKSTAQASFELSDVDLTSPMNTEIVLLVGFVPSNPTAIAVSNIDMYLINDSNFGMYYVIGEKKGDHIHYLSRGMVEDNTKVHIESFTQSSLSQSGNIIIQALYFGHTEYMQTKPVNATISINNHDFYRAKSYKENDYFDENAIIVNINEVDFAAAIESLKDSDIAKIKKEKDKKKPRPKKIDVNNPDIEEVDLHIHEIMEDHSHLSNGEILDIQMGRFETTLEGAIKARQPKIVFIHGVGNGRLKFRLRKALDDKYSKLRYQDASFKEYGYGATMVMIK